MNFRKLLFILVIALIGFTSCDNDDKFEPNIIIGSWQYSNIEQFVIDTNRDSLTAAIKYNEIELRKDSTILAFDKDSIVLTNKDGLNREQYKYSFDGRDRLTIQTSDSTSENRKFEVIGNIAIYKTGTAQRVSYTNKDGSINPKAFEILVAKYPETMAGLDIKDLKISNVYFFEIFKRQMMYY